VDQEKETPQQRQQSSGRRVSDCVFRRFADPLLPADLRFVRLSLELGAIPDSLAWQFQ